MSDCLFCRIAAGEIPARIVHADEHVIAFHDVAPKAPTHVLVIPRRHLASLSAAETADAPLLGRLLDACAGVARQLGLASYRVVVNNGEDAGQSVLHLHLHVLGGRGFSWPPG
ncbi:MAG: histidine triad nucleotide-binding protein [Acidobacteria bacterium]|nr:histidine triad nucleotide-binding protein [Acidobacteriota bacterium]